MLRWDTVDLNDTDKDSGAKLASVEGSLHHFKLGALGKLVFSASICFLFCKMGIIHKARNAHKWVDE